LLHEVADLTAPAWRDSPQAEGRPIRLSVEAEEGLVIAGWPASLREALTNLVFNAVDALPQGGTIRLAARRSTDRIAVEVEDSGVGMSPEVQERAFEPFYSTKGERGSGLGLAMVFGIVERHRGQITVDSSPGRGTTVHLSFPTASSSIPSKSTATTQAQPRGLHILAVDDEPELVQMVARILSKSGHTVATATSGEAALERLAIEPFDLVISDLGMGAGMNGWELHDHIHHRHPTVGFVLATGWAETIDPEEARRRGVQAVIAKPYLAADLEQLVATLSLRPRSS
jgi:CheY-like chemotaxis protein/anti-sigma regulatory factor (Ser/Thr protein kinase)